MDCRLNKNLSIPVAPQSLRRLHVCSHRSCQACCGLWKFGRLSRSGLVFQPRIVPRSGDTGRVSTTGRSLRPDRFTGSGGAERTLEACPAVGSAGNCLVGATEQICVTCRTRLTSGDSGCRNPFGAGKMVGVRKNLSQCRMIGFMIRLPLTRRVAARLLP